MNLSRVFFGNALDFRTNAAVWGQHLFYQWKWKKNPASHSSDSNRSLSDAIEEKGFAILPAAVDVQTLGNAIREYYQTPRPIHEGYAEMDKEAAGKLAALLMPVIEKVRPTVRTFYQSDFQPLWAIIQRISPGEIPNAPGSSLGFHSDNNPTRSLKLMLYLQDTDRHSGAFRLFDRKTTKRLCQKTDFISETGYDRASAHNQLEEEFGEKLKNWIHYCEGPAGTVVLFDNNLLHKGTLPETGVRDTVVLQLFPSDRPTEEKDLFRALTVKQTSSPIDVSKKNILRKLSTLYQGFRNVSV